jgi:hypothetical protein
VISVIDGGVCLAQLFQIKGQFARGLQQVILARTDAEMALSGQLRHLFEVQRLVVGLGAEALRGSTGCLCHYILLKGRLRLLWHGYIQK